MIDRDANERRSPVALVSLSGAATAAVIWRHRDVVKVTVVVKAAYVISPHGELEPAPEVAIATGEAAVDSELAPLLTRPEIHVRTRRAGTLHLAIYRGQQRLAAKSDEAVAFTAVSASTPHRARALAGVTGEVLLAIPDDFDWSAMHAAPEDQRVDSLAGGDWVVLGAAGDEQALRIQLPRVAASLQPYGHAASIPAPQLDIVHVDLDAMRCSLVWRASFVVTHPNTLDELTVAAAVHPADVDFSFPVALPLATAASPMREDRAFTSQREGSPLASAITSTSTGAPIVVRPALPFAAAANGDLAPALDATAFDVTPRSAPALPFVAGSGGGHRHAVGSVGAPWEAPASPVPRQAGANTLRLVVGGGASSPGHAVSDAAQADSDASKMNAPPAPPQPVVAVPPIDAATKNATVCSAPELPALMDVVTLEQRRAAERVAKLRVFREEERQLREEIQAMRDAEDAARREEERLAREATLAEQKRSKEQADRDEAERLRDRAAAHAVVRRQAERINHALYGFRLQ